MQPDDSASRQYKCVKCGLPTSRMLKDGAVCTKCFIEGWGRLLGMELPQPFIQEVKPPVKAPLYISRKDREKSKRR